MSVTSIMHCRHVVAFLSHDCDKLRVEENWCREDAINMFRVRTTVIESVVLAATVVVHCMLIKQSENLIWFSFSDISDNNNANYIKI